MALEDQYPQTPGTGPPGRPEPSDGSPLDAAAPLAGDESLTCGRPLSHAWEQARDAGPTADPHTASCPYCREAVEGLAALNEATRALRAQEPPSVRTLADRIMGIVRAEVRLGRMLPLDDPALDLRIAENTAAKVLRQAADTVPGAKAASCRLVPTGDGTGVHVAMTVAAALDHPLPDRAEQVRRSVLDAAGQSLGLAVTGVDIEVVDALEPPVPPVRADSGPAESGGT
ncbi:Asp23/Gls24 family envelope stress response protein [Actinacidiphila oryziradicis]|uniref:hypothetical protein n=1 Tax=Actinacidiphila oryziradicis TaxID=2571141 RepID=UPI00145D57AF|nr:hypothetical protein [Actinacidiphila oryziradicis]